MFTLDKKDLKALVSSWSRITKVFTPQMEYGQVMLLSYDESRFTMDYANFTFPVKEYLFKQQEILFRWNNKNGSINVENTQRSDIEEHIYFGVRPCDVYGIRYMDKFFLEGYRDQFYGANRDAAVIVAVNCTEPGVNCFCSSMGTGPFADSGYDLLFTPIKDAFLVEVGTDKGRKLIASSGSLFLEAKEAFLQEKGQLEQTACDKFTTKIEAENLNELLERNFDNPIWLELSKACTSCTGCTNVCPTCTCFNVVEKASGQDRGCRIRCWDSCQSDSFTRNANEHNPRSRESRFRYRIYDKFKYIEDRFDMKGCTGCGRCTDACPASIKLTEIINKLTENGSDEKGHGGE